MIGRMFARALGAVIVGLFVASGALAQERDVNSPNYMEYYEPGIWIDPDGCAHWAMDDGAEGYMDIILKRDGTPVCNRSQACGVVMSDQLFATGRHHINSAGRARLQQFFQSAGAFGYMIYGHTDGRASDEYNMRLSERRAAAVADVARSVGARVVDVKGFGKRRPKASNATAQGMAQNRRVEIYCLR